LLPPAGLPPSRAGALAGLQASGLPSGAQQVPLSVLDPRATLHAAPAASDLHAASASGGGPCRGCPAAPPSSLGCAATVPVHRHTIANTVAADGAREPRAIAARFDMSKTPVEPAPCRP
jgi:hypothetical protein